MELHGCIQSCQLVPRITNGNAPILQSRAQFLKTPASLSGDTFYWNAVIQGHLNAGEPYFAVLSYRDMLIAGALPDRHSIPRVLPACQLSSISTGLQIHAHALKLCLFRDSYVLFALMQLYAQIGGADAASSILSYSNPNSCVAYTLLSKLYFLENNPDSALQVFFHLAASDIEIDPIALATALKACRQMKSARYGRMVLDISKNRNLHSNILVENSLLKMYIEFGRMEESRSLFDSMPSKDAVSWTTMVHSNVQIGRFNDGLKLFRAMVAHGAKPDEFTVCSVLPACARMAARKHGTEIHAFVIKQNIELSTAVQNALIDMHSKSGSVDYAYKVFVKMPEKDILSWTVMILAYSLHGLGELGVALFHKFVEEAGVEPDCASYAAALHACGTACLVDQGEKILKMIGLENANLEHFVLMARILARSGQLVQAWSFLEAHLIEQVLCALLTVLDGCRIHSNTRMGRQVAERLLELNPLVAENYVLLSNMYAANRKCGTPTKLKQMMTDMGLKPKKACSWIEVRCKIHVFSTGDISHPRSERIYLELRGLMKRMEEEGYKPIEDFTFHDVDEEMECVPCGHSEMLAIAFGLISTRAGTIVRVTKNMRVCRNCHESAKMISRVTGRDIMLKDPERFHRFVNGSCSCLDVW